MKELPFRQIHLDFHTAPEISGVGSAFDPSAFAARLKRAHVDSISMFARCHHGMIYYDSKLSPERVHPGLVRKELLREQIEACHAAGIRAPVYITVQWDIFTARQHPEWLARKEDGSVNDQKPYEAGFYGTLCVNTPYRDWLKAHTAEVLDTLPVDALFFDIVQIKDCSCESCRRGMAAEGLDAHDKAQRLGYAERMLNGFMEDMTAFVKKRNPECGIFYNRGHVGTSHRASAASFTHFELESLPSGGWGYMHFPLTMRYARTLGLDCMSHTGKFHTSWGDFHSFKNQAALEFECFHMLALNAKCLIGDQLEPKGELSAPVYELVGKVYEQVEAKEAWCRGAKAMTEIGLLTPEEFVGTEGIELDHSLIGAGRMLAEGGHQFDVLDSKSDIFRYKVLVLPDSIPVSPAFAAKLGSFIDKGGSLIASFESGLDESGTGFALDALGVTVMDRQAEDFRGKPVRGLHYERGDYSDYLLPRGAIGRGLPETEHVMYMKGLMVEAGPGTEVLADAILPTFDRDYRHFCSHRQAPSSGKRGYAGIVKKGRAIYFAHPIFKQYDRNAPRWCKRLFLNAIAMLLPEPVLRHDGPSGVITALNDQPAERRLVAHLLYYVPERRSMDIDVIEDVVPLRDIGLSLNLAGRTIKRVRLAPQGTELPFGMKAERLELRIPLIAGHQMISLEY